MIQNLFQTRYSTHFKDCEEIIMILNKIIITSRNNLKADEDLKRKNKRKKDDEKKESENE